jgi:hypothetical protein
MKDRPFFPATGVGPETDSRQTADNIDMSGKICMWDAFGEYWCEGGAAARPAQQQQQQQAWAPPSNIEGFYQANGGDDTDKEKKDPAASTTTTGATTTGEPPKEGFCGCGSPLTG